MNEEVNTEESLYSKTAVTGSAEDALKGHEEVKITSSDTKNIEVKTEEPDKDPSKDKEAPEDKEEKAAEEKPLEERIKEHKAAEKDVKTDLAGKGLDFDQFAEEYEENGNLSNATLEALDKAGYPKSVVNAYIAGLEATAEKYTNTILDMAGGKEAYARMTGFVQSLGTADVNAFNQAIEEGNLAQIKVLFKGYTAQMSEKYGTAKRSILGTGGASPKGGFNSKTEMVKAMEDKRYGRDPDYTREVERKTAKSAFLG